MTVLVLKRESEFLLVLPDKFLFDRRLEARVQRNAANDLFIIEYSAGSQYKFVYY